MISRLIFSLLVLLASTAITGCSGWGDVPSGLRVGTGLEPEYIDQQVRFRTTYYFRVLEGCPLKKNESDDFSTVSELFTKRISGNLVPLSDSLYRFRMTGQAAALFNKVHFESGVMRKEQIDPFGSTVRYNEEANSFLPISADQLRSQAKNDAAMNDISRMRKLIEEFKKDTNFTNESKQAFELQLMDIIQNRLEVIKTNPRAIETKDKTLATGPQPRASTQGQSSSTTSQPDIATQGQPSSATTPSGTGTPSPGPPAATSTDPSATSQIHVTHQRSCNGQPSLKKYYLLGPEGSKELDPSDRLLMALSVDSKPLLGMLQQISEHKFQSHETSLHIMEDILDERGRVFDAQRTLLNAKDKTTSEDGSPVRPSLSALLDSLRSSFPAPSTTIK